MQQPNDFNRRMKQARLDAGMTLMDVAFELRNRMPRSMCPSLSKVQRLEVDRPEAKADAYLVTVLATLYGKSVSELSLTAANELDALREQVIQAQPCIPASAA